MKSDPKVIYNKMLDGDALTNTEVIEGSAFYIKLAEDLSACGPAFRLAANEAHRVGRNLKDFREARNV
jgi:hypothetical protein